MPGQIIIINGKSGSGKSTTCETFAQRSEAFWLIYGIDHFMGSTFPRKFDHLRRPRLPNCAPAILIRGAAPSG